MLSIALASLLSAPAFAEDDSSTNPDSDLSEAETSYRGFERVLMNVGSVGQPRDEDPRAAYGLVDTDLELASIRRVSYDVERVQAKIRAAGLPDVLANRLALGV